VRGGPVLGIIGNGLRLVRDREPASSGGVDGVCCMPSGELLRVGGAGLCDRVVRGRFILAGVVVGVHGMSRGKLLHISGAWVGVGGVRSGHVPSDDGRVELGKLLKLPLRDLLGAGGERVLQLRLRDVLVDGGFFIVRVVWRRDLLVGGLERVHGLRGGNLPGLSRGLELRELPRGHDLGVGGVGVL